MEECSISQFFQIKKIHPEQSLINLSSSGVFSPSDDLAKEVFEASEVSGEKYWRMPLEESYWDSMKSSVADMVNTGGRQGGSITAALFLKQVHKLLIFLSLYPLYPSKYKDRNFELGGETVLMTNTIQKTPSSLHNKRRERMKIRQPPMLPKITFHSFLFFYLE